MELFRDLRLPAMRRFLAPRSGAVAFLEASAASCVASLPERRREIIAAAVMEAHVQLIPGPDLLCGNQLSHLLIRVLISQPTAASLALSATCKS
jgi:hypothetical protein